MQELDTRPIFLSMTREEYYSRYDILSHVGNLFIPKVGVLSRDRHYEIAKNIFKGETLYLRERVEHSRVFGNSNGAQLFASVTPYDVIPECPVNLPIGLHVSFSWRDRMPTWEQMKEVKTATFGDELEAFQLFPRKEIYYSFHQYCLHLWELPYTWIVTTP